MLVYLTYYQAQGQYNASRVDTKPLTAWLQLAPGETDVELRVWVDQFIGEAYFQQGREVITFDAPPTAKAGVLLRTRPILGQGLGPSRAHGGVGGAVPAVSAVAWAMGSIYATVEQVLAAPRMDN